MITLLDHGYIKLIESWGSDERIIEAARMSTDKGFLGWGPVCPHCNRKVRTALLHADPTAMKCYGTKDEPGCGTVEAKSGDEKLLRYLYENKHSTPFEMAGAVLEVQAPIFVIREWERHRTQSYAELSARYTPLPDVNYIPTVERLLINSKTNKQAGVIKGADVLDEAGAERFRSALAAMYVTQESLYQTALSSGVPKELARVHLPVGRYSRMRAAANLRNWLGFMTLRSAPAAQYEIRVYSGALSTILTSLFPRTMALFAESAAKGRP